MIDKLRNIFSFSEIRGEKYIFWGEIK